MSCNVWAPGCKIGSDDDDDDDDVVDHDFDGGDDNADEVGDQAAAA